MRPYNFDSMVDGNQWIAVAGLHYAKVFIVQNILQFLIFKPDILDLFLRGLRFRLSDNLVCCSARARRRHLGRSCYESPLLLVQVQGLIRLSIEAFNEDTHSILDTVASSQSNHPLSSRLRTDPFAGLLLVGGRYPGPVVLFRGASLRKNRRDVGPCICTHIYRSVLWALIDDQSINRCQCPIPKQNVSIAFTGVAAKKISKERVCYTGKPERGLHPIIDDCCSRFFSIEFFTFQKSMPGTFGTRIIPLEKITQIVVIVLII